MEKKKFVVWTNYEPVVVTNTYKQACRIIARQLAQDDYAKEIANNRYVPRSKISSRAKIHYSIIETDVDAWVRRGANKILNIIASDREGRIYNSRFAISTTILHRN